MDVFSTLVLQLGTSTKTPHVMEYIHNKHFPAQKNKRKNNYQTLHAPNVQDAWENINKRNSKVTIEIQSTLTHSIPTCYPTIPN